VDNDLGGEGIQIETHAVTEQNESCNNRLIARPPAQLASWVCYWKGFRKMAGGRSRHNTQIIGDVHHSFTGGEKLKKPLERQASGVRSLHRIE